MRERSIILVLLLLSWAYFLWPTPYVNGVRELPQFGEPSRTAFRVQTNRFTGTVWAETLGGWRRFEGQPLIRSRLAFEEDAYLAGRDLSDHSSRIPDLWP